MSNLKTDIIISRNSIKAVEERIKDDLRVFQTAEWLSVTGEAFVASVCYDENDRIKGYLPLVETTKFGIKGYHIPPYTPYFGPVVLETDLFKKTKVIEKLLKPFFKSKHIDFIISPNDKDIVNFSSIGFSVQASQTHIIDSKTDYGINSIHGSKRRYLKKLKDLHNTGKLFIKSGREAISSLIALNDATEKRAGFKGNSHVLKLLLEKFGTEETVSVVFTENGEPLSGAFYPHDSYYAYHLINASARHNDNLLDKANLLSAFNAVEKTINSGKSFDFEGSNIPGVAGFYRMMGGMPAINLRLQKSNSYFYSLMRA